jgi:hypothetical protein
MFRFPCIKREFIYVLLRKVVYFCVFRYDSSASTVDRETVHFNNSFSSSGLTALEVAWAASHH